ncbi:MULTISPECIES: 6-phosphogluconolactonase [Parafrankia]|uniref:6-phosphogluconolactonase n=1 Tax=Parafrankia TaxID=2994362 RepID=UPI000B87FE56|nr:MULTISPECIES: 6-phosphogluconolactonase [Parafrankia]MBE3202065.1 6-phosphogluconolactonase [Parafrankia sp. CH37]
MTTTPTAAASAPARVVVHADAGVLVRAAAARLVTALVDAQAERSVASVVLTGGGIGIALLRALRGSPALDAVDWSRVDVWWGDDRFVPADSPDRNDRQAWEALLEHIPLDPSRVFPMAPFTPARAAGDIESASDSAPAEGAGNAARLASIRPAGVEEPETAAVAYAAELAARAEPGSPVPVFDVLLLGLGPETHVASIFPDSPASVATEPVAAVRDCPKPPPTRVTLTPPTLRSARQVWVVAAGEEKAEAVATALRPGADPVKWPAAGAVGREATLWLVDRAAASRLHASQAGVR